MATATDDEETARRRDEVIKRMLDTPPQPRPAKPQKASRSTDVKDSHDRYSVKPKS
jgi:hypothetical protein